MLTEYKLQINSKLRKLGENSKAFLGLLFQISGMVTGLYEPQKHILLHWINLTDLKSKFALNFFAYLLELSVCQR